VRGWRRLDGDHSSRSRQATTIANQTSSCSWLWSGLIPPFLVLFFCLYELRSGQQAPCLRTKSHKVEMRNVVRLYF